MWQMDDGANVTDKRQRAKTSKTKDVDYLEIQIDYSKLIRRRWIIFM